METWVRKLIAKLKEIMQKANSARRRDDGDSRKDMRPIFKPLDEEGEFADRVNDSFPNVYLTFISIIQGVALGLLATTTFEYIEKSGFPVPWVERVEFLHRPLISFFIIVIVAYEYTFLVGVFRWSPRIWDTVIPFVLGASEIIPMFLLEHPSTWWCSTAVFFVIGVWALANTLWHCRDQKPVFGKNTKACKRTRKYIRTDLGIAFLAAVISLIVSYMLSNEVIEKDQHGVVLFIIFFVLACVMMLRHEMFLNKLYEDFDLRR